MMVEYSFHIQDPSDPDTLYLYEAIIDQLTTHDVVRWSAIFAFATGTAVRNLFVEDQQVSQLIASANVDVVVGVDAVTDVSALQELSEITDRCPNFQARVFMNPTVRLFHPKICRFDRSNGTSALLVGSGNLTAGGLRSNLEAFSIVSGSPAEVHSSAWDSFLLRHAADIRDIGQEAFALAATNQRIRSRRHPAITETEPEEPSIVSAQISESQVEPVFDNPCVLVAQIPAAGDRWHQIHFNADIIRDFFKASANTSQRLFMQSIDPTGITGQEEVRPVIYSNANRNYKIEMGYRHDSGYPQDGRPLLVVEEVAVRSFLYTILMPGEPGYLELSNFVLRSATIGRGLPRVVTQLTTLRGVWSNTPF